MSSIIFSKTFYQRFDFNYSIKLHCDAKHEFYTCTIELKRESFPLPIPPPINIPMEYMKDIIIYMKTLYGILEKNQALISEQEMEENEQEIAFSVLLYKDREQRISSSIAVGSFNKTLLVVLHADVKDDFWIRDIRLDIDELNGLSMAFDEAEEEFNKLNADVKNKRKLKTGLLIQPFGLESLIYEKIEKKCGRSFK